MSLLTQRSGYYVAIAINRAYLGLYGSRYTVPCDVNITDRAHGTIKMFKSFDIDAYSFHCSIGTPVHIATVPNTYTASQTKIHRLTLNVYYRRRGAIINTIFNVLTTAYSYS